MARRRRSRRSYVVELALVGIILALLFAFIYLGWFEAFGRWFAERMMAHGPAR